MHMTGPHMQPLSSGVLISPPGEDGISVAAFYRRGNTTPTVSSPIDLNNLPSRVRLRDEVMQRMKSPGESLFINFESLRPPSMEEGSVTFKILSLLHALPSELKETLFSPPVMHDLFRFINTPWIVGNEYIKSDSMKNRRRSLSVSSLPSREEVLQKFKCFTSAILSCRIDKAQNDRNGSEVDGVNSPVVAKFLESLKQVEPFFYPYFESNPQGKSDLTLSKGLVSSEVIGLLKATLISVLDSTGAVRPELVCCSSIAYLLPLLSLAYLLHAKELRKYLLTILRDNFTGLKTTIEEEGMESTLAASLFDVFSDYIQDYNIPSFSNHQVSPVKSITLTHAAANNEVIAGRASSTSTSTITTRSDIITQEIPKTSTAHVPTSLVPASNSNTTPTEEDELSSRDKRISAQELRQKQREEELERFASFQKQAALKSLYEEKRVKETVEIYHKINPDSVPSQSWCYTTMSSIDESGKDEEERGEKREDSAVSDDDDCGGAGGSFIEHQVNVKEEEEEEGDDDEVIGYLATRAKERDVSAGVVLAEIRASKYKESLQSKKLLEAEEEMKERRRKMNLAQLVLHQKELRSTMKVSGRKRTSHHGDRVVEIHPTETVRVKLNESERGKDDLEVVEARRRALERVRDNRTYMKYLERREERDRAKRRARLFQERDDRLEAFREKQREKEEREYYRITGLHFRGGVDNDKVMRRGGRGNKHHIQQSDRNKRDGIPLKAKSFSPSRKGRLVVKSQTEQGKDDSLPRVPPPPVSMLSAHSRSIRPPPPPPPPPPISNRLRAVESWKREEEMFLTALFGDGETKGDHGSIGPSVASVSVTTGEDDQERRIMREVHNLLSDTSPRFQSPSHGSSHKELKRGDLEVERVGNPPPPPPLPPPPSSTHGLQRSPKQHPLTVKTGKDIVRTKVPVRLIKKRVISSEELERKEKREAEKREIERLALEKSLLREKKAEVRVNDKERVEVLPGKKGVNIKKSILKVTQSIAGMTASSSDGIVSMKEKTPKKVVKIVDQVDVNWRKSGGNGAVADSRKRIHQPVASESVDGGDTKQGEQTFEESSSPKYYDGSSGHADLPLSPAYGRGNRNHESEGVSSSFGLESPSSWRDVSDLKNDTDDEDVSKSHKQSRFKFDFDDDDDKEEAGGDMLSREEVGDEEETEDEEEEEGGDGGFVIHDDDI